MDKALRRVGCQSAGQSNKKGDRSRLWKKSENNSGQLNKPDPVSSSKSESEQGFMDFQLTNSIIILKSVDIE